MRTTFRRQVTLIVSLLLAATILLGVSFWGLFTHYVIRERESSLRGTAQSVVWLMQTSAVSDDVTTSWDFLRTLSVTSSASGNDILLCDVNGEVKLCAQDIQGCSHIGYRLPADKVEALFNGESPDLNDEATEIYGQRRVAVALAGSTADGERQGIVLVSVERETISEVTSGALKIFMLTALAVFAVALLATPFLTNRETKPIQDMAAAARQIAHGNLNVRVSTNCQTEEMEELAVAFNNMAAAMQNADTARQEFVANVSHELKTPMTTIAGYLDGMLDGTIPQPEQRHYMELVSTEVRRLSRLVRNMLEISRLKDQGIPADKLADFDLCEAAGQALLSFEQRINRKHLNVDVDMPELGVTVRAMPDAVTQVLYNLIDNAVKFIDDGGTLSIRVERSGNKAVTTVGNTGPTIAPEELPLIFDRFHKTDKSRSTDRDGVGLGLKIAVIDSDVDSDGVGVRIGTDNVEAGRMAGRAALQTDWDSLTVGIVNFDLGSRNGQERESGFREALAGDPRVKDIYTINVNTDATTAQVRTVQLLVEHPEINVIVGFNEPIAVGAAMAVHSLGLTGRVRMVGFDTNVKCIDLLQSGAVSALIVQNPYAMGYLGVEAVCNLLDGQTYRTAELLDTATRTVTKETMFTIENQKALFSFG